MTVHYGDPKDYQTTKVPYHFVVDIDGIEMDPEKPTKYILNMMANEVSLDMESQIINGIYDESVKQKKNPIKKIFDKIKQSSSLLDSGFIFAPYIPLIVTPPIIFAQENNLVLTPNKDGIKANY